MGHNRQSILHDFFRERDGLFSFLVAALVLGAGIELSIQALADWSKLPTGLRVMAGLLLIVLAVIYFVYQASRSIGGKKQMTGFIVLTEDGEPPECVSRYDYSDNLNLYFRSGLAENSALERDWRTTGLGFCTSITGSVEQREAASSAQLLCEATEYYFLNALSTHLIDHFNGQDAGLETLEREGVADVLLSNRFFELFSKNHTCRSGFPEEMGEKGGAMGPIYILMTESRVLFQQFELTLPKGSAVRRTKKNSIEIRTPRVVFQVSIDFEGHAFAFPAGFRRRYLRVKGQGKIRAFKIGVTIEATVHPRGLILSGGWRQYRWIDSFLEMVEKGFDANRFFNDIAWESSNTVLECLENPERV